jgi:hypothetical protein
MGIEIHRCGDIGRQQNSHGAGLEQQARCQEDPDGSQTDVAPAHLRSINPCLVNEYHRSVKRGVKHVLAMVETEAGPLDMKDLFGGVIAGRKAKEVLVV